TSDPFDCGGCGNVCTSQQVCNAGACTAACDPGLTDCYGACLNTEVNHNNCGLCGRACTTAQSCVTGACVCNSAHPDICNGACTNEQNDPTNCGQCGMTCNAN